jgi:integrase
MIGGVYSDQKCPLCGGRFYDDGKTGLQCRNHPDQKATEFRISFKGVYRRFKDYDDARQVLEGLRFKYREGIFDKRDYLSSNPLAFGNVSAEWLKIKEKELNPRSYNATFNHIKRASIHFGNKNIKNIEYADLEDLKLALLEELKSKTVANIFSDLHQFFSWFKKRKYIRDYQPPEFPRIDVVLGYRNFTTKEKQIEILRELHSLVWDINPKIYIGVLMLMVYPSIRPKELRGIKEMDFNFDDPGVRIPFPKEKRYKFVPMIQEDIDLIRSLIDPAIDTRLLPYFRHPRGIKGAVENHPFSKNLFYDWWKRAAKNVGITDVDLYGGTKHTTVTDMNRRHSPETIQKTAQISTNKAFDRYLHLDNEQKRALCREAHPDTVPTRIIEFPKNPKSSEHQ